MKYEWRNLSADRAPLAVALVLCVSIAYGAFNGWAWVRFQRETIAAAQGEERARLSAIQEDIGKLNAGEKTAPAFADPRLPQSLGRNMGPRYAAMPPAPLGSLSIGQSDLYPYYFKVSTNSKETFLNNDEIENPVHLLAGRFDLSFVFIYLFPLVIMAFSYNIVSAEREAGTLAMVLSQPVSLGRVVAGKIVVRAAFLLILALGLSIAGVLLGGLDLSADGAISRLLLWVAVTIAYGGLWFVLAIAVNAAGKSSATNAMSLAGLWLALTIVIPAVLNVAVKSAYPVPSRVEMIQAIRAAGEESTKQGSQLLARYLEDHPELAPKEQNERAAPDFGTLLVALNAATERKVEPVLANFTRQLGKQQEIVERLQYLSPAVVTQSAYDDVAGSGVYRHRHFLAQVDEYHEQWRSFFVPRILRKEKVTAADIEKLPEFRYRMEDTGAVVGRVVRALSGLVVPLLLIGGAAVWALRRYPVAG